MIILNVSQSKKCCRKKYCNHHIWLKIIHGTYEWEDSLSKSCWLHPIIKNTHSSLFQMKYAEHQGKNKIMKLSPVCTMIVKQVPTSQYILQRDAKNRFQKSYTWKLWFQTTFWHGSSSHSPTHGHHSLSKVNASSVFLFWSSFFYHSFVKK